MRFYLSRVFFYFHLEKNDHEASPPIFDLITRVVIKTDIVEEKNKRRFH